MNDEKLLTHAPLGKKSEYVNTYTPNLLFPLPRQIKRDEIGINEDLPFKGFDIWNGYELSWLNLKGKPVVAIGKFLIPCESWYLIESKSFKLYLNSLNQSRFESIAQVEAMIRKDLSGAAGSPVEVTLKDLINSSQIITSLNGQSLDDLDIECTEFSPQPNYLNTNEPWVSETVHSHLLKSNCLVTGQPDWGSIEISYEGRQINHEGLLKYIVSLRNHNEFHEQCVERIFLDIYKVCQPKWLSVYARYTRRGGLDINPFRTNLPALPFVQNNRLVRQ